MVCVPPCTASMTPSGSSPRSVCVTVECVARETFTDGMVGARSASVSAVGLGTRLSPS
jgi:hypothetical protein